METKELNEKLDLVLQNTKEVQKACEELDVKVNEHEGIKEVVEKTASAIEDIQLARQKEAGEVAALKEITGKLEESLCRAVKGANDGAVKQFAEYGDAFNRYLKTGVEMDSELVSEVVDGIVNKSLSGASPEQVAAITKSMVVGSNPRGGYLVRPEVSAMMIQRVFETSPLRAVANVQTVSSDSLEIIIDDNEASDGGWVGEVTPRPETDTPEIGELVIPVHEIFAQPKVSQKFLDDAGVDVESWLQGKVTRKISRTENTAFIRGDGSRKPKGLLAYADADAWQTYQRTRIQTYTATGTAGQLDNADDLKTLQNGLKEEYQANSIWGMKRATFGDIIILKDNDDRYIFESRFINERDQMVLLGKDVVFMNDLDDVAADALPIVYGDFSEGYTIVDRMGFRVLRDDLTEKPFIKFYTTKRTGGDVTSYDSWNRLRINA